MISTAGMYKITTYFQDFRATPNQGCSESYYIQPPASPSAGMTAYKSYLLARMGLSGAGLQFLGARVRNYNVPSYDILYDANSLSLTVPQQFGSYVPTASASPIGNLPLEDALLIRYSADSGAKSHSFVHGVPLAIVASGTELNEDASWESAFIAFQAQTQNKWQVWDRHLDAFANATFVIDAKLTARKVGRPFGQQNGRRI